MILAKRLKAIVKEERYSQREFAEMVDIPLRSLENYLSGRQEPTTGVIMKIVNHIKFKKYTMWLMTGDVSPESGQISPDFSTQVICGLKTLQEEKKA